MAYKIIYKKRFQTKLFQLLDYLKKEWGDNVANSFINRLQKRLNTLSQQPYIGASSIVIKSVRSILITKHNRLYYRIKDDTIEVLNMYDTRSNPKKNPYKKVD
ncbi:MAG TPA: type II toxin-antitoxin system RelE/ParE family toxin [Parafilimonas sp.]|nr:type II toxin-antitoxin system RelE/ParE family toxin [Parafilimonas sp.]